MVTPDEHDSTTDERPSVRVLDAIAEHDGTDPTVIQPVLYDVIDPDALDALFSETPLGESRADGYVTFQYGSLEVTVDSDGEVEIESVRTGSSESTPSSGTASNDR